MSSFRRPRGFLSTYEYDELGRIQTTHDGAGGSLTISRASDTAEGFAVEKTTALGRTTRYAVASPPGVDRVRTVRLPSGALLETGEGSDGTVTSTSPDGTLTVARFAPDPRFGMEAPYVDRTVVRLPSGLSSVTASSRTAELSDASDPLSLPSERTEPTGLVGSAVGGVWRRDHSLREQAPNSLLPKSHARSKQSWQISALPSNQAASIEIEGEERYVGRWSEH
ncbi:MAG: hypothetical protein HYV07_30355 [Deltaproteobacteria bacterium]|nr:hypothetical protein [Deltaproteobacteria bacterium]